ncbi:MAG TPA: hemerythrin domain-containing protein [Candidatus Dormibacteraeota bacterium]|nr:hemerythrin domain-containing protein [Candidatus Dormibacteraeota bacterium]
MISTEASEPTSFLDELRWVHSLLRRDLEACQTLAESVDGGAPADRVREEIEALRRRGPLFQLQLNCLRFCQFVHGHHGAEDAALFPAVRRANPELGPSVDRLEADHRRVSDLLREVELASLSLSAEEGGPERMRLSHRLRELASHLLEHLAFEEESLGPILATWRRLPL